VPRCIRLELAAKEFPELDVTFRGAVSIAPAAAGSLAELVKIDPNQSGVGHTNMGRVRQVKTGAQPDAGGRRRVKRLWRGPEHRSAPC